jgi:hypothetical protein
MDFRSIKRQKYPIVHPVGFHTYTCAFREFPGRYGSVPVSFRLETDEFLCQSGDEKNLENNGFRYRMFSSGSGLFRPRNGWNLQEKHGFLQYPAGSSSENH